MHACRPLLRYARVFATPRRLAASRMHTGALRVDTPATRAGHAPRVWMFTRAQDKKKMAIKITVTAEDKYGLKATPAVINVVMKVLCCINVCGAPRARCFLPPC